MELKSYYIKRYILSIIYPNRCPFCDKVIEHNIYFHSECEEKLDKYNHNAVIAVYYYNDISKNFMMQAKEEANGYAVSAAAKLLYEKLCEIDIFKNIDVITSIPSTKQSKNERGYSFPELLAKETAEIAGLRYKKLLKSMNKSRRQKELNAAERAENIKGAFSIISSGKFDIKGVKVLLIDDVYTTGATIKEAGRMLENAGASVVKAAFMRTQLNKNETGIET